MIAIDDRERGEIYFKQMISKSKRQIINIHPGLRFIMRSDS